MSDKATSTLAAILLSVQLAMAMPALADNPMGYRLVSPEEAAALPHGSAALGLDVGRAERITSNGLSFDLLLVKVARPGTPAARAGLKAGDEIIAVDGTVFSTVAAFASYIGSLDKAGRVAIDYIPSGGGPQQAQRLVVKLGSRGGDSSRSADLGHTGLSIGEKIAIGAGAAALIGCYEYGCLSRLRDKAREQSPLLPQKP